jgi:exopolysaccharide biosynthesis protein
MHYKYFGKEASMKKLSLLIFIISFVLLNTYIVEARSSKRSIDIVELTCSDALQIKDSQTQKALFIWSDGYQSAKSGNTVVDIPQLESLAGQLETHCKINPSASFFQAVQNSKKTKSMVSSLTKKDKKKGRYSNIDMAKVTGEDALKEKDRQVLKAVLIWIDGYQSAKSGITVVDTDQLQTMAERLESSFRANPSMLLLDAVNKTKKGASPAKSSTGGVRVAENDGSNIDMTKVTCSEALQIKDSQTQKAVVIWIDGYRSAKSGNTSVDINKLKNLADRIGGYCRANPSALLLEAVGGK